MCDTTTIKTKDYTMKTTNILLSLAVMGTLTLGFAQENSAIDEAVSVHKEAMQTASPETRAELMNRVKEKIASMTPQQREEAMQRMQANMPSDARNSMQANATEMRMEHSEDMNRVQNMNQQQAGSQYGHDAREAGGSVNMENIQESGSSWNDRY